MNALLLPRAALLLASTLLAACSQPGPSGPSPTAAAAWPRLTRTRLVAFGDSLTAGATSPAFTILSAGLPQSYPFKMLDLLRQRYPDQIFEMINEGKPAETIADAVVRLPGVLRDSAPDVVLLLHGVNDITFAGLAGVPGALGHLSALARQARLAGAEVVVATLPPQRAGGFRAADPAVIVSYNDGIRTGARADGIVLVDLAATFGDLSLIGVDGLHPTEAGYERMAALFVAAVAARYEHDARR